MLFKILHGDASRISTDITPYHEGYCYVTHDGYFYVDMNNERVRLNANEANKLVGYNIASALNSSEAEIPNSKAILDYLDAHTYDENDAMKLIAEMGLIEPTVDENGAVYIDENGVIYTL